MLITDKSLLHWIHHFYGFGSWQAKCWFVSYEEGGGDLPEDVADRFNYFQNIHAQPDQLCDIREMYKHLPIRWEGPKADKFSDRFAYRFGDQAVLQGVWKNLIRFIHGYRGEQVPDLITYQREKFLSPLSKKEALIQLYPLPSPHNHGWYYSWLDLPEQKFLKMRSLYEDHVYPFRILHILRAIRTYQPELVLMYGMNNINKLKASVSEFFPEAQFTLVKATRQVTPQHHKAQIGRTRLLITTQIPALRHNRVETGFEWEEFGIEVRGSKFNVQG